MTARDSTFAIPGRPERTFPRSGGVEYEGGTVFVLSPDGDDGDGSGGDGRDGDREAAEGPDGDFEGADDPDGDGAEGADRDGADVGGPDGDLEARIGAVLAAGPYRYGDFHELPMALFLVRDEETGDVFRVAVRDGTVRLHVLPETDSAGLRRFHDRLVEHTGREWRVECRTDGG